MELLSNFFQAKQRAGRFFSLYYSVFEFMWQHKKTQLLLSFFFSLTGTFCLILAMLITISFLNAMGAEDSQEISIVVFKWTIPKDQTSLILVSVTCFLLLLSGAVFNYQATRISRGVGRFVHSALVGDVLNIFSSSYPTDKVVKEYGVRGIQVMISRDALQSGIAAQRLIDAVRPILYIIVGIIIAAILQPTVVTVMLPCFVIIVPVFFYLGSRINDNARAFYSATARNYQGVVIGLIKRLNNSNRQTDEYRFFSREQYRQLPSTKEYLDRFDENLLGNFKMTFVSSVFKGLVFVALLLITGRAALNGEIDWQRLVSFFIVLAFVLNGLNTLVSYLANLNRLYPQVQEVFRFVKRFSVDACSSGLTLKSFPGFLLTYYEGSKLNQFSFERGVPVYIYSAQLLDRISIGSYIVPALTSADKTLLEGHLCFTNRHAIPGRETDYVQIPDLLSVMDVRQFKSTIELDSLIEITGISSITLEHWNTLGMKAQNIIRIVSVVTEPSPIVILDSALFRGLSLKVCQCLIQALSDKRILVHIENKNDLLSDLVMGIIIVEDLAISKIESAEWLALNLASLGFAQHASPINEIEEGIDEFV